MNRQTDGDAVRAWAEALRTGLGLVRFTDLPKESFDELLNGAAFRSRGFHLSIAQHATMEGLEHLEGAFSGDQEIMEAVERRRAELTRVGGNVVAFPSSVSRNASVRGHQKMTPKKANNSGLWSGRLRTAFGRFLAAFEEQPGAFDQPQLDTKSSADVPLVSAGERAARNDAPA